MRRSRLSPHSKTRKSRTLADGREILSKCDWDVRRLLVIVAAHGRCRECGSKWNVSVHHIIPRGRGRDDRESNLIVLCGKCHRAKHSKPQW